MFYESEGTVEERRAYLSQHYEVFMVPCYGKLLKVFIVDNAMWKKTLISNWSYAQVSGLLPLGDDGWNTETIVTIPKCIPVGGRMAFATYWITLFGTHDERDAYYAELRRLKFCDMDENDRNTYAKNLWKLMLKLLKMKKSVPKRMRDLIMRGITVRILIDGFRQISGPDDENNPFSL